MPCSSAGRTWTSSPWGARTKTPRSSKTRNPWDLDRIPGGSSGGAAACVAARHGAASRSAPTPAARFASRPACAASPGLKPTYGRVSRYGLVAFASSLDQIGPLARTAEDAALLLRSDRRARSARFDVDRLFPCRQYSQTVNQPLADLRLGLVREHFGAGLDGEVEAAVREAIRRLRIARGEGRSSSRCRTANMASPPITSSRPCEASSNLARYDGVHYGYRTDESQDDRASWPSEAKQLEAAGDKAAADELDNPLVRMYRRSRGPKVLGRSETPHHARHLRPERRLLRRLLSQSPQGPPPDPPGLRRSLQASRSDRRAGHQHAGLQDRRKESTIRWRCIWSTCTRSAPNLAGIGGIAFPCGFSKTGLPIGLQLQGPPLEEDRLLRAAHMFQQATDWHTRQTAVVTN